MSTLASTVRPRRLALAVVPAALLAALTACSSPPSPAFDLSAPRQRVSGQGTGGQLAVSEPAAIAPFEAERIIAKDAAGSVSYLGGAQWVDRLPRLIQARMVETFENSSRVRASRPGDGATPDFQLSTELRAFQFDAANGQALVELTAKLVNLKTGTIARTRLFSAREPVGSAAGPEVAQALDRALSTVLLDTVRWVGSGR